MSSHLTEHDEQVTVVEWARYNQSRYPALRLLHASANGGLRHIITARRMKSEGVQAGIPDLFLPHAAGGYHGLFIEMKIKGGKLSQAQTWWLEALNAQGYKAVVCYGAIEAIACLKSYLEDNPGQALDKSSAQA